MINPQHPFKGIYAIVDTHVHAHYCPSKLLKQIVFESTLSVIQLRMKNESLAYKEKIIKIAADLKLSRDFVLIINDDIDFLDHAAIDGIHVGQKDMPVHKIRQRYPHKIIGASVHNLNEAIDAQNQGASYLGCGCLFETNSKQNTRKLELAELVKIIKNVTIPVVAIGGIQLTNLPQVVATSAHMAALVSGLIDDEIFVGQELQEIFLKYHIPLLR